MQPDIGHVASAFCVGAVLLGLPAIAALVLAIVLTVQLGRAPPPARPMAVRNPDAILLTLEGMTRVIGVFGRVFGVIGRLAAIALAVLSIAGLAFAGLLYFTGGGLAAHDAWARETAIVVSGFLLVASVLSMVAVRRWWRALALVIAAAAIYALVALFQGYR